MIPKTDLFHQIVYQDNDFLIMACYVEVNPDYKVFYIHTGNFVGCTNSPFWMSNCRAIMNWYKKHFLQ